MINNEQITTALNLLVNVAKQESAASPQHLVIKRYVTSDALVIVATDPRARELIYGLVEHARQVLGGHVHFEPLDN